MLLRTPKSCYDFLRSAFGLVRSSDPCRRYAANYRNYRREDWSPFHARRVARSERVVASKWQKAKALPKKPCATRSVTSPNTSGVTEGGEQGRDGSPQVACGGRR